MGDGVHAAGRGQPGGQGEGEVGVVEDADRQHAGVAAGALGAAVGDAPDGGHLRAGVGGGDGDHGQGVLQRDGLAQADRGAAADGDAAVGADLGGEFSGAVGGLDRDVHAGFGQHGGGAVAECVGDQLAGGFLFGGTEHEHAGEAEGGDLVG